MIRAYASYPASQKWLHWVIAALILTLIPVGLTMTRIGEGPLTGQLYELHKSFGLIVITLAVIRIIVRWRRGAPPLERHIPRWQRAAAYLSHYALYALIVLVPLAGWAATSACCPPVRLFGTLPLTLPVPQDEALSHRIFSLHYALAYALAAIVAVHVAAALHHHFVRRDNTLRRMLPGA